MNNRPGVYSNILPGAEPFECGSGESAILFIHGWSSTPRDLRFLAETLKDSFFCKGILLPGHGRTSHRAMLDYKWVDFIHYAQEQYDILAASYRKIYLVGISFGGSISLELAKTRNIERMVLLAPFINTPKIPLPFITIRDIVHLFPNLDIAFPKSNETAINNPEARSDHIHYGKMHIKALKQLFIASRNFSKNLQAVTCPTLLIHSTGDKTSCFKNSVYILKRLGSQIKHLMALNNSNHIITLDYDRPTVEKAVKNWFLHTL